MQRNRFIKINLIIWIYVALLFVSLAFKGGTPDSDAILGNWLIGSGRMRITIYNKNGIYEGKVVWLKKIENAVNSTTNTDLKFKPTVKEGEIILSNLVFNKNEKKWGNGIFINPDNGKKLNCEIKLLTEKKLLVTTFNYFTFLGKSDTWYKVKKANPSNN